MSRAQRIRRLAMVPLTVSVFGPAGERVSGVKVTLAADGGDNVRRTISRERNGPLYQAKLPTGVYDVRVEFINNVVPKKDTPKPKKVYVAPPMARVSFLCSGASAPVGMEGQYSSQSARQRTANPSRQRQFDVQGLNKAQEYLRNRRRDPEGRCSERPICVAAIEFGGINWCDPSIVTRSPLRDGMHQILDCYDFADEFTRCNFRYQAADRHAMGVFSIIAAQNPGKKILGIAHDARYLPITCRRPLQTESHADILLWAAGLAHPKSLRRNTKLPAPPIYPSDVINCSHSVQPTEEAKVCDAVDRAFRDLTTFGRNGRGSIVVFAAGNQGGYVSTCNVFAAHPRTIAVANSGIDEDDNERYVSRGFVQTEGGGPSNIGPEIDICAAGEGVVVLDETGKLQTFGGTSAAAAMVSGAVALMLSVNPDLTWVDVRDILRNTAKKIDLDNTAPDGQWRSGFSRWYGYGRLRIDDAVRAADEYKTKDVCLVIRHDLPELVSASIAGDFLTSPDIWVRTERPTFDEPTAMYDKDPPHTDPQSHETNWVCVRIRNIGTCSASDFFVRLYLVHLKKINLHYPADLLPIMEYKPECPDDCPASDQFVQGSYLLGEQFGTDVRPDEQRVFYFEWPYKWIPPDSVRGREWNPCLVAEVSPRTGGDPRDNLLQSYPNIAMRLIRINRP